MSTIHRGLRTHDYAHIRVSSAHYRWAVKLSDTGEVRNVREVNLRVVSAPPCTGSGITTRSHHEVRDNETNLTESLSSDRRLHGTHDALAGRHHHRPPLAVTTPHELPPLLQPSKGSDGANVSTAQTINGGVLPSHAENSGDDSSHSSAFPPRASGRGNAPLGNGHDSNTDRRHDNGDSNNNIRSDDSTAAPPLHRVRARDAARRNRPGSGGGGGGAGGNGRSGDARDGDGRGDESVVDVSGGGGEHTSATVGDDGVHGGVVHAKPTDGGDDHATAPAVLPRLDMPATNASRTEGQHQVDAQARDRSNPDHGRGDSSIPDHGRGDSSIPDHRQDDASLPEGHQEVETPPELRHGGPLGGRRVPRAARRADSIAVSKARRQRTQRSHDSLETDATTVFASSATPTATTATTTSTITTATMEDLMETGKERQNTTDASLDPSMQGTHPARGQADPHEDISPRDQASIWVGPPTLHVEPHGAMPHADPKRVMEIISRIRHSHATSKHEHDALQPGESDAYDSSKTINVDTGQRDGDAGAVGGGADARGGVRGGADVRGGVRDGAYAGGGGDQKRGYSDALRTFTTPSAIANAMDTLSLREIRTRMRRRGAGGTTPGDDDPARAPDSTGASAVAVAAPPADDSNTVGNTSSTESVRVCGFPSVFFFNAYRSLDLTERAKALNCGLLSLKGLSVLLFRLFSLFR